MQLWKTEADSAQWFSCALLVRTAENVHSAVTISPKNVWPDGLRSPESGLRGEL